MLIICVCVWLLIYTCVQLLSYTQCAAAVHKHWTLHFWGNVLLSNEYKFVHTKMSTCRQTSVHVYLELTALWSHSITRWHHSGHHSVKGLHLKETCWIFLPRSPFQTLNESTDSTLDLHHPLEFSVVWREPRIFYTAADSQRMAVMLYFPKVHLFYSAWTSKTGYQGYLRRLRVKILYWKYFEHIFSVQKKQFKPLSPHFRKSVFTLNWPWHCCTALLYCQ